MEVYNEAESQYSPRLRIFSSCCNRHVRKSQLNGSHGEATNSDDVKRLDQAQNRRLERIEQKLSQMSLEKKKSTKKKNGKSKRPSSAPKTFRTFGASAAAPAIESFDAQKPIGTIQPDMVSAVAQVAPFRIPKGIASVLTNPRPSQKITARAIGSVTVANGSTLLGNFSPCVASDNGVTLVTASAMLPVYITSNGADATTCFTSATVGTSAANVTEGRLTTNTPYPAATLSGNDYNWRLVSSGIRVRNITAVINRAGVIRVLVDRHRNLYSYASIPTTPYATIANAIEANHKTVRHAMGATPDFEISVPHSLVADFAVADYTSGNGGWAQTVDTPGQQLWYGAGVGNIRYGGTTSVIKGGVGETWVLFANTTGATQALDFELIEHWEICGSAIETLHTPSASHAAAYDLLQNVTGHAHAHHSMTPSLPLHTLVKDAVKLEHNKSAVKDAGLVATALALI